MLKRRLSVLSVAVCCQTALAAEWGYQGATGPSNWAALDQANVLCAEGGEQSPVDLVATTSTEENPLRRSIGQPMLDFTERAHVLDLIDNGHTIQVTSDASLSMWLDGIRYGLVQFHFHAPSEHTIEGRRFPLESHFVMSNEEGGLAVLGVLYEAGAHDPAFDAVMAALPDAPGDERHLEDLDLDLAELKPLPRRYYRYEGSLTTPPCSEGVRWVVLAEPETMSAAQIELLAAHLHHNNRPLQPKNERELVLVGAEDSDPQP